MSSFCYVRKIFLALFITIFTKKLVESYSINDLNVCGKKILRTAKIIGGVESPVGSWAWQVIKILYLLLSIFFKSESFKKLREAKITKLSRNSKISFLIEIRISFFS